MSKKSKEQIAKERLTNGVKISSKEGKILPQTDATIKEYLFVNGNIIGGNGNFSDLREEK